MIHCQDHGFDGFWDYTDFWMEHGLAGWKGYSENDIRKEFAFSALKKSVPSGNPWQSVVQTLKELI